jgi:methionyl-tRNA formyltransferase
VHDCLAAIGARLVVQGLHDAAAGRLRPLAQPLDGVTYAAKIDKAEAPIDWHAPAPVIERRLRAFDPAPGCHFEDQGQRIKLWRGRVVDASGAPGTLVPTGDASRRVVACGVGALELVEVQPAGGRRMPAATWLRGRAQA